MVIKGGQADWATAYKLLKASQYEQVVEFLREAQGAREQTGDTVLADTLAAAQQICLACNQCRTEVEWHRTACKEAEQREHELKQQLYAILNLVSERGASETREDPVALPPVPADKLNLPERNVSKSVERPGLLQRIQSLLGRVGTPRLPEQEAPAGSAIALAAPSAGGTKVPVTLSLENAEALEAPPVEPEKQQDQGLASLAIYCLGLFRVFNNGQLVEKWPGHKCKSIFKYMIIYHEHPIHREILMDLFWRDVEPEAARRNLYQAIYSLRQALQTGDPDFSYILCEDSCYRLNPDLELWVDSEAFTLHYQTGQRLEREDRMREAVREYEAADSLYEGEFLAEDRYEDWPLVHRENLKHAHLDILDRLSQHYFDQAQLAMCIAFCQKILAEDSCREDAHRRLMRCYLRQGQRYLALRQYHLCVEALKRELDVPPMSTTVELCQQIQKSRVQFPSA